MKQDLHMLPYTARRTALHGEAPEAGLRALTDSADTAAVRLRFCLLAPDRSHCGAPCFSCAGSHPPAAADKLAELPIDDYALRPARTTAASSPTPGALALVDWLESNAKGSFWGIMRCERWGKNSASLHAEGRAVDWHLDAPRPADRREARRLIDLLARHRREPATSTRSRAGWGSRRSSGTAARGGRARTGWARTPRATPSAASAQARELHARRTRTTSTSGCPVAGRPEAHLVLASA